jgi:hypothetical protein
MMKTEKTREKHGHEKRDADFRKLMLTGIGLFGLMVFGLLFSWWIYEIFSARTSSPGSPAETFVVREAHSMPPAPRLQPRPHEELAALRKIEDSILTSYGWVDKEKGIGHIPIERAMNIFVANQGKETR